MSEAPDTVARRVRRWLMVPAVVAAFGVVGVALRDGADPTPATAAQRASALSKMRCPPDGPCFALLRAPAGQCSALVDADGWDPTLRGPLPCPGTQGFAWSTVAPGTRLRRLLACGRIEGAVEAWHAWYPEGTGPGSPCGLHLMIPRAAARAWVDRLDADTAVAFVDERAATAPPEFRRGAGRAHTWAGVDPSDDAHEDPPAVTP